MIDFFTGLGDEMWVQLKRLCSRAQPNSSFYVCRFRCQEWRVQDVICGDKLLLIDNVTSWCWSKLLARVCVGLTIADIGVSEVVLK